MVDFIADTEDLTEFVDQKVVEVINNKEEEEEVIEEAFFSSKNGHMLHTRLALFDTALFKKMNICLNEYSGFLNK